MRIRPLLIIAFVSILALNIAAQKKPVFTSAYTSLGGSACKFYNGKDGQDGLTLCNGPGGYQVRIYSSAMMTHIVAELKGTDESFSLGNVSLGFNQSKSKVEWRLANGKPFAAIFRTPKYADPADGESGVGKVIGEELTVIGLKGHNDLSESIDGKTANANVKAREAADKGYSPK